MLNWWFLSEVLTRWPNGKYYFRIILFIIILCNILESTNLNSFFIYILKVIICVLVFITLIILSKISYSIRKNQAILRSTVGKKAVVTEEINSENKTGKVMVDGEEFEAKSNIISVIQKYSVVIIDDYDKYFLIVS